MSRTHMTIQDLFFCIDHRYVNMSLVENKDTIHITIIDTPISDTYVDKAKHTQD